MKRIFAICFFALVFAGCASTKSATVPTAEETMKAGLLDGMLAATKASLFELTCPPSGCVISSLKVGNPYAAAQAAETVKVVMAPQASTSEKVALAFIDRGFSALTFGLGAGAAKNIFGNMFASHTAVATGGFNALQKTASDAFSVNGTIASNIPQPGATITTTNTIGGQGVIGSGSLTTNDRHDVTNTGSNNTNPTPKVCSVNATGVQTCSGG